MSAGAWAMATARVLVANGRRVGGRWKRGSVDISESSNNADGSWRVYLANAGVILDYRPDLADPVTKGDLALDAAYRQACEQRDTERNKLAVAR